MKIFDELGTDGYMDYRVEICGEILCFPTKEEREKFLFRLYLDWLQKMLRSHELQEAMRWLMEQRQEDMLHMMEKYFSVFLALLIPLDNYFYSLPPNQMNQLNIRMIARDFMEMTLDLVLTTSTPTPAYQDKSTSHDPRI